MIFIEDTEVTLEDEKELTAEQKLALTGYDFAQEDILCFFSNLEVYQEELNIDGEDINLMRFLSNHPDVLDTFVWCLSDWIKCRRNEMVISFLDENASGIED